MRKRIEAALEYADGVLIGAPSHRPPAATQLVGNGLLPEFGQKRVLSKPIDMLVESIRKRNSIVSTALACKDRRSPAASYRRQPRA